MGFVTLEKRLDPFRNFDAWYAAQRKSNSRPGVTFQSGPNLGLRPCIKCREYWKRKPVLVVERSAVCRQCTFVYYSKGFTIRGRLTLDRVDESKLGRWELFIYKRLKALH